MAAEADYFDQAGNWTGPPRHKLQEIRINYNTFNGNLKKSPGDFLPADTFFIDLTLKEKDLLKKMRYNTRYNVKRAINTGVMVREYGKNEIQDWHKMNSETALRHHMPMQDKAYFGAILNNHDNERSSPYTISQISTTAR